MIDRWDRRPYLQRVGDALSQLVNTIVFNGMPDESISGRAWRNTAIRFNRGQKVKVRWWILRLLAETLFWPIDRWDHCRLAFWQDVMRSADRASAIKDYVE